MRVMVEYMALSLKIPLGLGEEAKTTSNLNLFDDVIIDLVASIDLLLFECEYCKVHKVMLRFMKRIVGILGTKVCIPCFTIVTTFVVKCIEIDLV
jgi:hypothetical protein